MCSSEDQLPEVLQDTTAEAEWASHLIILLHHNYIISHVLHQNSHSPILDGGGGVVGGGLGVVVGGEDVANFGNSALREIVSSSV